MTSLFSLLVVGLPAIDQSLDGLLRFLHGQTPDTIANLTGIAKAIGAVLALCVGAYECWMMMLGRRVIDVFKLFRIIGLSICITFASSICSILAFPGKQLETATHAMAQSKNTLVAHKEMQVAKLQDKYYQKVRALQDSIESAKQIKELGEDANWIDKLSYTIGNLGNTINDFSKRGAIVVETKITEWVNLVIRFIGEAIFQISYYGLLVMQLVFMKLLAMVAPVMFALSIVPPWSNAWSQWISKYVSISLWGFIVYLCVYYADAILLYTLEKDITAYQTLIGKSNIGSWDNIASLGMQGIGSTCMYFVGMCVGAVLIKSVPEVASWMIPGGVSSSSASNAGSSIISTTQVAGARVTQTASVVGGSAVAAAAGAASVAGAYSQSRGDGNSVARSMTNSIVSNTTLGQSYSAGANNARNLGNVGKNDENYKRKDNQ